MDDQMEELLLIVSELAQKYAGYESTSITYERAQSLMEAVLFCLNECDNSNADGLVHKSVKARERYQIGVKLLEEKVREIREIFHEMSPCFEDYGVKCLSYTVRNGIPQFLKWYDVKFCPQNTVIDLDYPLLIDCASLTGADAVYRYIRGIRTEQMFLGAFERNYVVSVLEKHNSEYRDMAENICGVVLTNIIGRIAIRKSVRDAEFQQEEYLQLSKAFGGKSVSEIESLVKGLIGEIVRRFYQDDAAMLEYLSCEAGHMAARIDAANRHGALRRIFMP